LNFLHNKLTRSFLESDVTTKQPLDGSGATATTRGTYQQACLLDSKGRLVDELGVGTLAVPTTTSSTSSPPLHRAFLLTSRGHSSRQLAERLNRYVFPLDEVDALKSVGGGGVGDGTGKEEDDDRDRDDKCFAFTLASTRRETLRRVFDDQIVPALLASSEREKEKEEDGDKGGIDFGNLQLPLSTECVWIESIGGDPSETSLLILPTCQLPTCAASGYTFCFISSDGASADKNVGRRIWEHLISESNADGPVEIGPLELETLRIEAGQPAYGREMTASDKDAKSPASPLELNLLETCIDTDKGCYMGQEGVASLLKNPRGPPRQLYQVVFDDETNLYQHQTTPPSSPNTDTNKDKSILATEKNANRTRRPRPGDALFVLGSNEEISVGSITSVAEPGGTGDAATFALALVRRADSILKQMKDADLDIPTPPATSEPDESEASGFIEPPPVSPLEGLEVIVGGTYTVGTLRAVPMKRLRSSAGIRNMFDEEVVVDVEPASTEATNDEKKLREVDAEATAAAAEAEAKAAEEAAAEAAADAERKAQKMEQLRQRAEAAMARRRAAKNKD